MFHFVDGAPATNNAIENYYSTSLKTHRKKQFRTDMGMINHIQLVTRVFSFHIEKLKKSLDFWIVPIKRWYLNRTMHSVISNCA